MEPGIGVFPIKPDRRQVPIAVAMALIRWSGYAMPRIQGAQMLGG
jgi:hypothetical protein